MTTMENGTVAQLVEGEHGYVQELDPIMGEEGEVFGNAGDGIRAGPERVFNPSIFGVVGIASLTLAKAVVLA